MSMWAEQRWLGGCWVDRENDNKPVAAVMHTDRWDGRVTIHWVNLSGGRQETIIKPQQKEETVWW